MSEKTVGKFTIHVTDPWPCWTRIELSGTTLPSIPHGDLADLLYGIQWAMREARAQLPDRNKDEV